MPTYVQLVHTGQRFLLACSYGYHRMLRGRRAKDISWVVGVDEIASMVHHIADAVPDSYAVSFRRNRYYEFPYDFCLNVRNERLFTVKRIILGPLLLGRLAASSAGFVYLGSSGFLIDGYDCRRFEFSFLTRRGKKIVCYFTGNDIRSPKLMLELEKATGVENLATHLAQVDPVFGTDEYDANKRSIAAVADEFASAIFNAAQDQLSYLTRKTEPFAYFYPDEQFLDSASKFENLGAPLIVHAPTSPKLKGTELVRQSIERLRAEGYDFIYRELIGVPNTTVLDELRRAQIVLNEFYAFVPGVFGVEAMASMCALLTSADERVERDLPAGSNSAWLVTRYDSIYQNLRGLLDHPESLLPLAERGHAWARQNASTSHSSRRIRQVLDAVLDGTYEK
jgi:hypothetical protein